MPQLPFARAQEASAPSMVSLAMAESIIAAAKAKAEQEGWAMSFAVVDNSGRPVAMVRMDGTRWMTPKVAHSKALTSATFGRPSASVQEFATGRPQLFKNVQKLIGEPLLPAGGGLPIMVGGKLLGGVGASGGTEAEDIGSGAGWTGCDWGGVNTHKGRTVVRPHSPPGNSYFYEPSPQPALPVMQKERKNPGRPSHGPCLQQIPARQR